MARVRRDDVDADLGPVIGEYRASLVSRRMAAAKRDWVGTTIFAVLYGITISLALGLLVLLLYVLLLISARGI